MTSTCGTYTAYKRGCRCQPCRTANADRGRWRRNNPRNPDMDRRPWRYLCLTVDHNNQECPLPLDHDGDHGWPVDVDRELVGVVLARHGMALA